MKGGEISRGERTRHINFARLSLNEGDNSPRDFLICGDERLSARN